jgi:hypothetical protein
VSYRRRAIAASSFCALVLVMPGATPVAAQIPGGTTINACYLADRDDDQGRLTRLVALNESCRDGEMRIHWSVAGPQGPIGPAGPQGLHGPRGDAGAAGLTGPQGLQGNQGAPFKFQGVFDPNGKYLPNDIVSFQGAGYLAVATPTIGGLPGIDLAWALLVAKGDPGPTGPAGANGATGPMGPSGPQGSMGVAGTVGPVGPQGPKGDMGATGAQGSQGAVGPTGSQGLKVVVAQTFFALSAFPVPATGYGTDAAVTATSTIPGSTFIASTQGGQLLIAVTASFYVPSGQALICQPNIDGAWAGAAAYFSATGDYFSQVPVARYITMSISRVYPAVSAATHAFSVGCSASGPGATLLIAFPVSFTVFEIQ